MFKRQEHSSNTELVTGEDRKEIGSGFTVNLPNNAVRPWKLPEPSRREGIEGIGVEKQKTCPHLRTAYFPSSLITFHALITTATRKHFPVSSEPATAPQSTGEFGWEGNPTKRWEAASWQRYKKIVPQSQHGCMQPAFAGTNKRQTKVSETSNLKRHPLQRTVVL